MRSTGRTHKLILPIHGQPGQSLAHCADILLSDLLTLREPFLYFDNIVMNC